MEKPTIFNETINKKTSSRNKSTIQYERGTLSQENRVFVENVALDAKNSKLPSGYDGGIIKKEFIDFEKEFPGLIFKSTDFLYDKMMNDAHNIFPRNRELKLRVSSYYEEMVRVNLNNLYHFAPRFFTENFVQRTTINNAAFEAYQVYLYLLCFISWTDKHRDDHEVREFDNIDKILNWISTRRDPSIDYILSGPSSNSNIINNDFRAHYKTLIDASNDMTSIIAYNQLSSTQTISSDLYALFHFVQNMPNVFFKSPDEARKYNVNIDSAQDVLVKIDNDNNLIFDCSYVNLGDVTEQNKLAKFDNLESVITNNKVQSMINTKKLAELFHNYSRLKILELIMTPDTYISSLDAFTKVFVVFKGVSCSERNIYNTIPTNFLKIGGKFVKTNRGYEFKMDVDAITYKSVLADVKSFEIYLTLDPNHTNQIIPNEYALSFSKHSVFQHAIATDIIYDSKVRGTRKTLTVRTEKQSPSKKNITDNSINACRTKIDLLPLFPSTLNTEKQAQLIVNGKYSPLNDPAKRLPQHKKTNIPYLDAQLFGSDEKTPTETLVNILHNRLKIINNLDKNDVISSVNKSIDIIHQIRSLTNDKFYLHYIERMTEILGKIRKSWTYDELLDEITLTLSMNGKLSDNNKGELLKAVNSDSFSRYTRKDKIVQIIDSYPLWSDLQALYDKNDGIGQVDKPIIESAFLHDVNIDPIKVSSVLEHLDNNTLTAEDVETIRGSVWQCMEKYNNTDILKSVILHDESPTEQQVQDLVNIITDYTSLTLQCILDVEKSLPQNYSFLASKLIKHLILTQQEKEQIIASIEQSTTISPSDKSQYIESIYSYNSPITSTDDLKALIREIVEYEDSAHLNGRINSDNYTSATIEQIIHIYKSYLSTQQHNIPYQLDEFINFILMLNDSSVYRITDTSNYILSKDTNINELNSFFTSVVSGGLLPVEDETEFINSFTALIEDYETIYNGYYSYFNRILNNAINDKIEDIEDIPSAFKAFKQLYSVLYNLLDPCEYTSGSVVDMYDYVVKDVDMQTGKIDGHYFRVNEMNGFAEFTDKDGNEYTTPDPEFLIYSESSNDLTLFNLYNKYNETIDPINKGSFIYSESLATLQNLNTQFLDYAGYQNLIKFDNSYLFTPGDEIYYMYYDKQNYISFEDMLNNITSNLTEIINPATDRTEYYRYTMNDDPESENTDVSILINFDDPDSIQTNLNHFNADITLSNYISRPVAMPDGSYAPSWIRSEHVIKVNNATFIKITDEKIINYHQAVLPNSDVPPKPSADPENTVSLFYVIGTIDEIVEVPLGVDTTDKNDAWSEAKTNELISFKARLINTSEYQNINPSMMDNDETSPQCLRTNAWRIEEFLIEPSLTKTSEDMIIRDTMNSQTIISPDYEISFVNNLGFTNLNELMSVSPESADDIYYIKQTTSRGTNAYTITYTYYHSQSLVTVSTKVEKEGSTSAFIETIYIHLDMKNMYKMNVTTEKIVTQKPSEGGETIIYEISNNVTGSDCDLLRLQSNDGLTSIFDAYHFSILDKYDNINEQYSNSYKAFKIDGIDIKRNYWNKSAFINSLMLCPLTSCVKKSSLASSPEESQRLIALMDAVSSESKPLTSTVEVNGMLDDVIIYDYINGFTRYKDIFKITPNDITRYDDDGNMINGVFQYIFITSNKKNVCYADINKTFSESGQRKRFAITDTTHLNYFIIEFTVDGEYISYITLQGAAEVFRPESETSQAWIPLGSCDYTIVSDQPNYIYNSALGLSFEVIIDYESDFKEFPNLKQVAVNNISITYVNYETTLYSVDQTTRSIMYSDVKTVKYSNIPAMLYDASDVLFRVSGAADEIYKIHPVFRYYEKAIVSPRYVNEDNEYIMLAQKYNQNIMAKPVYLRSQYNLNNPNVNTMKDSADIVYRVGNSLDADKKHLLESVNKNMLMFGNVENSGSIEDVAIRAQEIHAIPTASKMLLSIEFS